MKKIFYILVVCLILSGCQTMETDNFIVGESKETVEGAIEVAEKYQLNKIEQYEVNLKTDDLQMFWRDDTGNIFRSFRAVKDWLQSEKKQELVFAINGGIFMENRYPLGLYIENGVELSKLNKYKDEFGNFYIQPNGVFAISENKAFIIPTDDYQNIKEEIKYATQSGPIMVLDGEINNNLKAESKSRYLRNGVGLKSETEIVFAISNRPVTFYEFAEYFQKELGCDQALYLDGSISLMYAPEMKRYHNSGNFSVIIGVVK